MSLLTEDTGAWRMTSCINESHSQRLNSGAYKRSVFEIGEFIARYRNIWQQLYDNEIGGTEIGDSRGHIAMIVRLDVRQRMILNDIWLNEAQACEISKRNITGVISLSQLSSVLLTGVGGTQSDRFFFPRFPPLNCSSPGSYSRNVRILYPRIVSI
jgi:hypothetical protein